MSSQPPPPVAPPPPVVATTSAGQGRIGGILGGGLVVALGIGMMILPYLLFLVGGGGDTAAFGEFARSFLIPGLVVVVAGIALLVTGVVRSTRGGVPSGRILGAVALPVAILCAPAGLILGYVARSRSRRQGIADGLATGAIVIGWLGVAFLVLCALLAVAAWIYGSSVQYP